MNNHAHGKKQKSLREEMPSTAAFIDMLREAFGASAVDPQIKAGLRGAPVFHAIENGHEIGTPVQHWDAIGWDPVTGCAVDLSKKEGK